MSATTTGTGLKRLQHLVLWVSNVERSVRFYCEVVGFEVKRRYPNAAFLTIPGTADDHHLGLFEQTGVSRARTSARRACTTRRGKLATSPTWRGLVSGSATRALVGSFNHAASVSPLYAKDPDGLEVRDLLDGAGRRLDQDDRARSRRRARAARPDDVLTRWPDCGRCSDSTPPVPSGSFPSHFRQREPRPYRFSPPRKSCAVRDPTISPRRVTGRAIVLESARASTGAGRLAKKVLPSVGWDVPARIGCPAASGLRR